MSYIDTLEDDCLLEIFRKSNHPWCFRLNRRLNQLMTFATVQRPIFDFLQHIYWKKYKLIDPDALFVRTCVRYGLILYLRPNEIPLLFRRVKKSILSCSFVHIYLNMTSDVNEDVGQEQIEFYITNIQRLMKVANVSSIVYDKFFWSTLIEPLFPQTVRLFAERSFFDEKKCPDLSKCIDLEIIGNYTFANVKSGAVLTNCVELKLIRSFAFYSLETAVDLRNCKKLKIIENSAFYSLKQPPLLRGCETLQDIDASAFFSLLEAPDFRGCIRLKNIDNYSFYNIRTPVDFSDCHELEVIGAFAFYNLSEPPSFKQCIRLKYIGKKAFYNLKSLPDLSYCKSLEYIHPEAFPNLK